MTKWCVVPNCKSNRDQKWSMFRVPKDPVKWRKWEEAIPNITRLRQTDIVCEKHFDEKDISREWIKLDANDQVIARVIYKFPRLKKQAVPTIFSNSPIKNGNCERLHEDHLYAKHISSLPSTSVVLKQLRPKIGTDIKNIKISFSPILTISNPPPVLLVSQKSSEVPSSCKIDEQPVCHGKPNKPFVCYRCGKRYKSKTLLYHHQRDECEKHVKQLQYKCYCCHYKTKIRSNWIRHQKTHKDSNRDHEEPEMILGL